MNLKSFNIDELFDPKTGDYHATKELESGDIPLISCGDANNGLTGYYDIPEKNQYSHAVTVAYNGTYAYTAKFHPYSFGAKDDVAVLIPKTELSDKTLIYVAAMFNKERWRYSYSRKCFKSKLKTVKISLPANEDGNIDQEQIAQILEPVEANLPERNESSCTIEEPHIWKKEKLSSYFNIQKGDFNALPKIDGDVATVSRQTENNGIKGYYQPPEGADIYSPPKITMTTGGEYTGKAYVQTQPFIASDKVLILSPKENMELATLYFFQLSIDREQWRFSYGRSCFSQKAEELEVYVPKSNWNVLDTDYMKKVMNTTDYWQYIEKLGIKMRISNQIDHYKL